MPVSIIWEAIYFSKDTVCMENIQIKIWHKAKWTYVLPDEVHCTVAVEGVAGEVAAVAVVAAVVAAVAAAADTAEALYWSETTDIKKNMGKIIVDETLLHMIMARWINCWLCFGLPCYDWPAVVLQQQPQQLAAARQPFAETADSLLQIGCWGRLRPRLTAESKQREMLPE